MIFVWWDTKFTKLHAKNQVARQAKKNCSFEGAVFKYNIGCD